MPYWNGRPNLDEEVSHIVYGNQTLLHRLFEKNEEQTVQPVKTKKKLSRADKKQIEAAIARANRTIKRKIGHGQYPL